MRRSSRSHRRLVGALTAAAAAAALAATPAAGAPPSPGAAGIGDPLFPTLGNGGYDVRHYELNLRYADEAPDTPIDGTATITARATQALSRFDLDFAGASVGRVLVNRREAAFTRDGEELVITPRRPLATGERFRVRVEHFVAQPTVPDADDLLSVPFFVTPDGSATAPQPDGAHRIFPSNDHPRDKASYSIRFDVPAGVTAVGNGVLLRRRNAGERTIWRYEQRQPMATELVQLAVGGYDVIVRGRHRGVRIRDVTPPSLTADLDPLLALEIGHLDFMESRVGAFPFDAYGSLVVDTSLGFALETQTLSLFDIPWFRDYPQGLWEPVMVHELAHQWFGDSVSPYEWGDVWLNEGHATWYELLFAESKGFLPDDTQIPDVATVEDVMRIVYRIQDLLRADFGPPGRPPSGDPAELFNTNVYFGGALVLYALRQEIGVSAFERLERAWLRAYRGRSASSADFIALASRAADRDLTGFLNAWLYATATPPMPGHPDWTVDPPEEPSAEAAARALRTAAAAAELRRR